MFNRFFCICLFFILTLGLKGQKKSEQLHIEWPGKFQWKIIKHQDDSLQETIMMIPGYENVSNASILGVIRSNKDLHFNSVDSLLFFYEGGLDSATRFTLVDKNEDSKNPWILFKVETPVTRKYTEPESDLYYVIQGDYGLYENYVAIKWPSLSDDFVLRWSGIFKRAYLTTP